MADRRDITDAQEVVAAVEEQQPTTTINDLFGGDVADDQDPFAQLGSNNEEDLLDMSVSPETRTGGLQDLGEAKLFADASQSAHPAPNVPPEHVEPQPSELSVPLTHQSETIAPGGEASTVIEQEKDFSDLLAEFEAEQELVQDDELSGTRETAQDDPEGSATVQALDSRQAGVSIEDEREGDEATGEILHDKSTAPVLDPPVTASALFADEDDSDPFASIAPTESEQALQIVSDADSTPFESSQTIEQPAGLGIASSESDTLHGMFDDDSDWLGAGPGTATNDESPSGPKPDEGDKPLPFEVPQGWYDDAGEWHWYTEEEREQVRLTMLGQGGWSEDLAPASQEPEVVRERTPSLLYSPSLKAGVSENAARRTPVPETPATMPNDSYDPYAPTSAATTTTSSTTYFGQSTAGYTNSSSPYDPYSASSSAHSYTPSTAYDPYSPAPNSSARSYGIDNARGANPVSDPYAAPTPALLDPYAPASVMSGPSARAGSSVTPESKPAPRPQPQRVVSNAYDPPFLRPQKSFVRPAAAGTYASSPAFGVPPVPAVPVPPQAAPTPPPPSGPPRRNPGESRPQSRGPSYATPPPKSVPRAPSVADTNYGQDNVYSALSRSPSVSQDQPQIPAKTMSPPKPLQRPPPSAFDPPLRQKPMAPPPRPSSAASQQSHGLGYGQSSLAAPTTSFAAPPKANQSPLAPPRPLSRGPPSRRGSPMFETKPPARSDPTQRSRSPLQHPHEYGSGNFDQRGPSIPDFRSIASKSKTLDPYSEPENHSDDIETSTSGQGLQPPAELNMPHISPPVLSRKYEEEDDEDDIGDHEEAHALTPSTSKEVPKPSFKASQPPALSYQPEPAYNHEDTYNAGSSNQASPRRSIPDDPYAPSSLGLDAYGPPSTQTAATPASYSPHAPVQGGARFVDLGNDDPYGITAGQPAQSATPYNNAYAPSAASTSPARSVGRLAPSAYDASPYSPSTAVKPVGLPQAYDPYAPTGGPARTASPAYSTGFGASPPLNNYFQSMHVDQPADPTYIPQQVLDQKPVSEDPLGRCTLAARNAPIAVFGFGGVLVTAFPGAAESGDFQKGHNRAPSYGYASGRGQVWIRNISEVAEPSAFQSDQAAFPGPLVFDATTPKGAAGDKKRKEAVLKYLDERAEEIEKGLPYLKSSANKARREEEGRLVLIRALKALVIGDGKLSGSPEIEEALRAALANPSSPAITASPVTSHAMSGFSSSLYPPAHATTATPVSASASQLAHLSGLLAQGSKRDAALYASDQGLWSHALVISSSVDVELWRSTVARFAASELGEKPQGTAGIKASYLLFGGIDPANIDELVKAATISEDPSTDQWREVIGAVFFNAKPSELACLDELGSKFLSLGLNNAAHACFLLSPLSPFFDATVAAYERQVMLTHNHRDEEAIIFAEIAEYARSLLPSPPKGQESYTAGLPQLLPYKLARAWRLAEIGQIELAQKYCRAIETGSKFGKNMPSLLAPSYTASLEDLLERLTGTPSINPASGFGGNRKAGNKPGFDKLGSWIEGRLTKFIAGEEGDDAPASKPTPRNQAAGPFSHFSTISPNASGTLSRQASTADMGGPAPNGYLGVQPVSRTTSPSLQMTSNQWGQPPASGQGHRHGQTSSSSSSSYGDQYNQHAGVSSYSHWSGGNDADDTNDQGMETPHAPAQGYDAYSGTGANDADNGDFISPMAQLNLGPSAPAATSYDPPKSRQVVEDEDDEDDLGFGNKALSRNRTPKPSDAAEDDNTASNGKGAQKATSAKTEPAKAAPAAPAKPEQKSSWLGRIWGKKEADPAATGPTKANLGEESSMVFDPELKRWVVKGAKVDAAPPAAAPPPPRAQTASPSQSARPEPPSAARASSAAPPLAAGGSRPPPMSAAHGNTFPRSAGPPSGFAEGADGGIKRVKSSLNESVTAADVATPPVPSMPPGIGARPPSGGPPARSAPPGASIDDLLSRPPSKRPGSAAAKKGARNRYVDVFQPGAEGS
ncbi:hypothetical protein IAU60_004194 [Kwoniella sp. DSM 27419]